MGMTESQILWRVRLPLARAVILAGIRTATIITIGVATIAAAIGAGGLGPSSSAALPWLAIQSSSPARFPAALLAIVADIVLSWVERR